MVSHREPQSVFPAHDQCGEGVLWHDTEQAVYWTDINRFLVHRLRPASACIRSWLWNEPVTAVIATDHDGTLAVVLASRVILWNPESDTRRDQGFRLSDWPKVRLNDAAVDPRGSLWIGGMRNNVGPDGSSFEAGGADGILYRLDPDGATSEWKRSIGISNTLVWSPDRTRFYFADSLANVIWTYRYDNATGRISDERPFLVDFPRGLPDGSAMDADGYLWNCRYGGSCIVRVAPRGDIDSVIEMPTPNITNCAFGGVDRKTLYATSAGLGAPTGDKLAGGLFAVETDVAGQPENRFRLLNRRAEHEK